MPRITRLRRSMQRVVTIHGQPRVVTIGLQGLVIRPLRGREGEAVLLKWEDLEREGGLLDGAELSHRPILSKAFGARK